jgi:hypothetical protein
MFEALRSELLLSAAGWFRSQLAQVLVQLP